MTEEQKNLLAQFGSPDYKNVLMWIEVYEGNKEEYYHPLIDNLVRFVKRIFGETGEDWGYISDNDLDYAQELEECGTYQGDTFPELLSYVYTNYISLVFKGHIPYLYPDIKDIDFRMSEIKSLPSALPSQLEYLAIGLAETFTEFPPLPDTLETFDVDGGNIFRFPVLPDNLFGLLIENCPLKELPVLPDKLGRISLINVGEHEIKRLPDNLTYISIRGKIKLPPPHDSIMGHHGVYMDKVAYALNKDEWDKAGVAIKR